MALTDDLSKYGIQLYRQGNRVFYGTTGALGQGTYTGEITDPNSLVSQGIDLNSLTDYGGREVTAPYGSTTGTNYSSIDPLLNIFRQREAGIAQEQQYAQQAQQMPAGVVQGPVTSTNTAGWYTPESLAQYNNGTLNAPLQVPAGSPGAALQPYLGQNVTQGATPGSIVPNQSVGAAPQQVNYGSMVDQALAQSGQIPQLDNMNGSQLEQIMGQLQGGGQSQGNSYLDLFNQSQTSLKPLQDQLLDIQKQEAALNASYRFGQNNIEGQTIPMQFIQGQQAGLERQYNARMANFIDREKIAASQLQNAQGLAEGQYEARVKDYEAARDERIRQQSNMNDAKTFAQENGITKPFYTLDGIEVFRTLDGKHYDNEQQFYADGGQFNQVQQVQNVQPGKIEQVGSSLLQIQPDGTVKVLYREPSSDGGGGLNDPLVQAVLNNPELFNQLTPTEKGRISPALSALGFNAFGKALSPTEKTNIANAQSGLSALTKIEQELKNNPYAAYYSAIPGSPGARTYTAAVKEASDVLTRLRTGAALNESEQAFYQSQLPKPFDSAGTIAYKISVFRDLFNKLVTPQTTQYQPVPKDPLGIL